MPKSRIRKKKRDNRPQQELAVESSLPVESPRWLAPAMVTTFLIGLAWIVTFYISETRYPVPGIAPGTWSPDSPSSESASRSPHAGANYTPVILHSFSTHVN